jgi:hypothetical protein
MIIAFRSAKVRSGVSLRPMSHGPACLPEGLLEAVLGLIQTLNFLGVFKDLAAFAL